jgi:hypothetical protein
MLTKACSEVYDDDDDSLYYFLYHYFQSSNHWKPLQIKNSIVKQAANKCYKRKMVLYDAMYVSSSLLSSSSLKFESKR